MGIVLVKVSVLFSPFFSETQNVPYFCLPQDFLFVHSERLIFSEHLRWDSDSNIRPLNYTCFVTSSESFEDSFACPGYPAVISKSWHHNEKNPAHFRDHRNNRFPENVSVGSIAELESICRCAFQNFRIKLTNVLLLLAMPLSARPM
jgi:hypothetical protein